MSRFRKPCLQKRCSTCFSFVQQGPLKVSNDAKSILNDQEVQSDSLVRINLIYLELSEVSLFREYYQYSLPQGGVHKLRLQDEVGRWSKMSTFCQRLYHRKCQRRGVGGQKSQNLVNVVCERPLNIKNGDSDSIQVMNSTHLQFGKGELSILSIMIPLIHK